MTSYCMGTVHMREESGIGIRKQEDICVVRWQQKMEREGAAVMCDGRLFHRRVAATGNVTDFINIFNSSSSKKTTTVMKYLSRLSPYRSSDSASSQPNNFLSHQSQQLSFWMKYHSRWLLNMTALYKLLNALSCTIHFNIDPITSQIVSYYDSLFLTDNIMNTLVPSWIFMKALVCHEGTSEI